MKMMYVTALKRSIDKNGKKFKVVDTVELHEDIESLKAYVEKIRCLLFDETTHTPYTLEQNNKFYEEYVYKIGETKSRMDTSTFVENELNIFSIEVNDYNFLNFNVCGFLEYHITSELETTHCSEYVGFGAYAGERYTFEELTNLLNLAYSRNDILSPKASQEVLEIIDRLDEKYFLQYYPYMSKITRLAYFIDDILPYKGDVIAVGNAIHSSKLSLIDVNELESNTL